MERQQTVYSSGGQQWKMLQGNAIVGESETSAYAMMWNNDNEMTPYLLLALPK